MNNDLEKRLLVVLAELSALTDFTKITELQEKAEELEKDIFRDSVIELFGCNYEKHSYSTNYERYREEIMKMIKSDFVSENNYSKDKKEFINKHWDKIDEIIEILQDYVRLLNLEESEEDKKEEAKENE